MRIFSDSAKAALCLAFGGQLLFLYELECKVCSNSFTYNGNDVFLCKDDRADNREEEKTALDVARCFFKLCCTVLF